MKIALTPRSTLALQAALLLIAGCTADDPVDTARRPAPRETPAQQVVVRDVTPAPAAPVEKVDVEPVALTSIVGPSVEQESDATADATLADPRGEGLAAWERGEYAAAARALRAADEAGIATPYDRYLLGLALWRDGSLEEAAAVLERAAGEMDGFVRAPVNLARVRLALGDAEGARTAIEQALAIDPDFAPARNVLGRVLMAEGDRDGAEAAFREAARLDEQDPWPAVNLGYLLLTTGRAEAAIEPLEQAVERDPELAAAWNDLALAREQVGDLEGALEAARRAEALSDDDRYRATATRLALLSGESESVTLPVVEPERRPEESEVAASEAESSPGGF